MLNIFKFELKSIYKSIFIWVCSILVFALLCLFMYPTFSKDVSTFSDLLKSFPPELIKALNIDISLWSQFTGFYAYLMTYVLLVAFSFSATLAIKIFNKEYKNRSIEFLFTKPTTRLNIFNAKLLALLVANILFFSLFSLIFIVVAKIVISDFITIDFLHLQLVVLLVQMLATLIATVFAIFFPKLKAAGSMGLSLAFLFFFLNTMGSILEVDALIKISVYGLYSPIDVIVDGFNYWHILGQFIIMLMLYLIGLTIYQRRDVL